MFIRLFLSLLLVIQVKAINAQLPSADSILKEATATASRENKNVFIIFHASWCIWCHKLDSSMNDKSCKVFFDDNYVIRHITVFEAQNKKRFENPGGLQLIVSLGARDKGLPFWLVLDKHGKLLSDSRMRDNEHNADTGGRNIGCPATGEEVDYFILVLKKTSQMTDEQLSLIKSRFRQNESR